jgi:hypothetical protein
MRARREVLLRDLVAQTGPLAGFMAELGVHNDTRRAYMDALLAARVRLRTAAGR